MSQRECNDYAINWAASEGWNPGLEDARCFYQTDPRGFFVGCLGSKVVGCISAVTYPDQFAFLGFYIVQAEFRGRGLGFQLWQAAMDRLQGKCIGLDGVVDQQDNYRKSGFRFAWNNMRFEGEVQHRRIDDRGIIPLRDVPMKQIIPYDQQHFPSKRSKFLNLWLDASPHLGFACLEHGEIAGYTVIRKCREGYKVGPLFANGPGIAERLFQTALNATTEGEKVYLDCPGPNARALQLADQYQMKKVFETARMYAGTPPELPLENMYGITSFELG